MRQLRSVAGALVAEDLVAAVAPLGMLEDVVRAAAFVLVEVVVQDEYTHDVVVAAGARFLVFDAT